MSEQIPIHHQIFLKYIDYLQLELRGKNLTQKEANIYISNVNALEQLVNNESLTIEEANLKLQEMFPGMSDIDNQNFDAVENIQKLRRESKLIEAFQKVMDVTNLEDIEQITQNWTKMLITNKYSGIKFTDLMDTFEYIASDHKEYLTRILSKPTLTQEDKLLRDREDIENTIKMLDGGDEDKLFARFNLDPTKTISYEQRVEMLKKLRGDNPV